MIEFKKLKLSTKILIPSILMIFTSNIITTYISSNKMEEMAFKNTRDSLSMLTDSIFLTLRNAMNSGDIDIIIEAEKSSREHIKGLESLVVAKSKNTIELFSPNEKLTTDKNILEVFDTKKELVLQMKDNNSDSIIIIDEDNKPTGIFTTKDFINLIYLNSDLSKPIGSYMTTPVYTLNEDSTVSEAIDFIRDKHFKRIVITNDENEVVGILTQKELLRIIYNKWIDFIKEEGNRISKINEELLTKTTKLEKKASMDFLTKLYNREKFNSFLDYEINKIKRYKEQYLSLLIVDIDYFKHVNDTHGHLVGDSVLQEIGKILSVCSRDSDIVARWGGEEFVVMLPQTNIEQAVFVAEKLRATVEKHKFDTVKHVTCSIGVSQFHKNEDKETLFKRTDKALYKAKNNGRNRVEMENMTIQN